MVLRQRLSKKAWLGSLLLHGAVILFFLLSFRGSFFTTPRLLEMPSSIRVDLVALPDKNPELPSSSQTSDQEAPLKEKKLPSKIENQDIDLKKEFSKEVVKEPLNKLEAPSLKPLLTVTKSEPLKESLAKIAKETSQKISKNQSQALNKIKAMAALDKIKNDVATEKADGPGGNLLKGQTQNQGNSLTGVMKIHHEAYIEKLDQHIKIHWVLPQWMTQKPYRTQIRVFMDAQGRILNKKIIKSSGNIAYDELAIETLEKSSPFPPPPEPLISFMESSGFVIGFPE